MSPLGRLSNAEILELIQSCPSEFNSIEGIKISVFLNTRNSSLYLASTPESPCTLLIKQVKSNDAKSQYNSLLSVFEKMAGSTYQVPRPITYIPEKNIVVMEYINSKCLGNLLLEKDINLYDKNKYIKESAHWVSAFHSTFRDGFEIVDSTKKIDDLSKTISVVKPVLYKHSELVSVLYWLESTAPFIQTRKAAFGHTHGDFKQANILYSKGNIYGIDIILDEKGVQLMDLVQFTNHLLFLTMTRKGKPYYKYVQGWINCFLDAYAKDQAGIDIEVFYWLRLQHLMRYWSFEAARKIPFAFIQKNKLKDEISAIYNSIRSDHLKLEFPKYTRVLDHVDYYPSKHDRIADEQHT